MELHIHNFKYQHNINLSIVAVGETGASGKAVSGEMVQETGWQDRSGFAGRYLSRLLDGTHVIEFDFGNNWTNVVYTRIR